MVKGILGRKIGMTQIYNESGAAIPVTVIEAGPCNVLLVRTKDRDGYEAVQLGFLDKPRRLASRSERGHVAAIESKRSKRNKESGVAAVPKAQCEPQRFVRELRGAIDGVAVGDQIKIDALTGVVAVDVVGVTKGRGFTGVMKRYHFKGMRSTHGTKKVHRHQGSTGCRTSPGRTFKGKRMAGHYGASNVTQRNVRVAKIDSDQNLLLLHGAVPGPVGGYLVIRETNMVK